MITNADHNDTTRLSLALLVQLFGERDADFRNWTGWWRVRVGDEVFLLLDDENGLAVAACCSGNCEAASIRGSIVAALIIERKLRHGLIASRLVLAHFSEDVEACGKAKGEETQDDERYEQIAHGWCKSGIL